MGNNNMLYIFFGEDSYSRDTAFKDFQKSLGDEEMISMNTVSLDAKDANIDEVLTMVQSVPFLASSRVIILEGLLTMFDKSNKTDFGQWTQIESVIENIPDSNYLVLIDGKLRSANPMLKLLEKKARSKEFIPLRGAPLRNWASRAADERGVAIEDDALSLLIDFCGNNLRSLESEIEKLSLYKHDEKIIDLSDVKLHVNYERDENIFRIVDQIFSKNYNSARLSFQHLLDSGTDSIEFILLLASQLRRLIVAKDLIDRKVPQGKFKSYLGTRSDFAVNKSVQQSRSFSMNQLMKMHREVVNLDLAIRSEPDKYSQGSLIDLLLLRMVSEDRNT